MLERCIQLYRDCVTICCTASHVMSRDSEYAKQICNTCAYIYVMHVLKSVKNISEWSTVNYVHKHVVNALKSVVEWQGSE